MTAGRLRGNGLVAFEACCAADVLAMGVFALVAPFYTVVIFFASVITFRQLDIVVAERARASKVYRILPQ